MWSLASGRSWVVGVVLVVAAVSACADESRSLAVVPRAKPGPHRVALVIGNNAYTHVPPLKNAVADARAIREALTARGFDVVYRENAGRHDFLAAVSVFLGKLSAESVGVVYYSGHGVQIRGENYLIPVDLEAVNLDEITADTVNLGDLLEKMRSRETRFKLAIIDACRNNPFPNATRGLGDEGGLAKPDPTGMIVVYAAGIGQTALDNLGPDDHDPHGLFTRELLKSLERPEQPVALVFSDTKVNVSRQAKQIGHEQHPAIYDESDGEFVFTDGAPASSADSPPVAAPVPAPAGKAVIASGSRAPSGAAPAAPADRGAMASGAAAHTLRSQESATRATLRFVNDSDQTVQIFWLDYHGQPRPYGELAPGAHRVQGTFLTHAWVVRAADPPHRELLHVVAHAASEEVHITLAATADAQTSSRTAMASPEAPETAATAVKAASLNSDTPALLRFINRSGKRVKLYWIDFDDQPQEYAELQPDETIVQETFLTHRWVVRDAAAPRPVLLSVTASQPKQKVIIGAVKD